MAVCKDPNWVLSGIAYTNYPKSILSLIVLNAQKQTLATGNLQFGQTTAERTNRTFILHCTIDLVHASLNIQVGLSDLNARLQLDRPQRIPVGIPLQVEQPIRARTAV